MSCFLASNIVAGSRIKDDQGRGDGSKKKYALIYNGIGSVEGCPEAVADIAKKIGLPVKYVSRINDIPNLLKAAAFFAIGGTVDNTEPMRKAFTPDIVRAIQDYLRGGGRYWGICGGAFMASHGWEIETGFVKAFGLVPAKTEYFINDQAPMLIPVLWRGQKRIMYYQAGPRFDLLDSKESVEKIATYKGGEIAALRCTYGRGKVSVSGPHPEATKAWLKEDGLDASGWKPTADLAIEMLKDLISN